jgi:hypothetical protein
MQVERLFVAEQALFLFRRRTFILEIECSKNTRRVGIYSPDIQIRYFCGMMQSRNLFSQFIGLHPQRGLEFWRYGACTIRSRLPFRQANNSQEGQI